jgi:hypothetical protein
LDVVGDGCARVSRVARARAAGARSCGWARSRTHTLSRRSRRTIRSRERALSTDQCAVTTRSVSGLRLSRVAPVAGRVGRTDRERDRGPRAHRTSECVVSRGRCSRSRVPDSRAVPPSRLARRHWHCLRVLGIRPILQCFLGYSHVNSALSLLLACCSLAHAHVSSTSSSRLHGTYVGYDSPVASSVIAHPGDIRHTRPR